MPKKAGFFEYVKRAFVNHWNLLLFGAGVVGGAFSGHADVVLPIVAAGEIVYLAGLASHSKFQAYVDAQLHKEGKEEAHSAVTAPALDRMFTSLDPASRARFEQVRRRCQELRALAEGVRPGVKDLAPMESMRMEGINKLLWVFLKLLYSRHAQQRFLHTTNEREIRDQIKEIEGKIANLGPVEEDTDNEVRMRRTLIDTLASANLRLDNLIKARDNFQFMELEIDRIDSKITSIAELAVNRQDPDFITSEVDGVAASMEQTEAAINDLHLLEIEDAEAPPPSFLDETLQS